MNIVGVRFGRYGPISYYDPVDTKLNIGDLVLVETVNGPQKATIIIDANQTFYVDIPHTSGRVLEKLKLPSLKIAK